MKVGIYCVKDNINGFMVPDFQSDESGAIRAFAYNVNQPGLMNFKPEDFSLWHIGAYDTDLGTVEYVDPQLLVHATDVIERRKKK